MEEITLETVEQMVDRLSVEEQKQLVAHIETQLQKTPAQAKPLRSLRGIWQGKVSEKHDVIADIRAIRDEWKEELEEPAQPRRPGSAIGKFFILAEDEEHLADFKEYMQ